MNEFLPKNSQMRWGQFRRAKGAKSSRQNHHDTCRHIGTYLRSMSALAISHSSTTGGFGTPLLGLHKLET
jgi:hypothetical protein